MTYLKELCPGPPLYYKEPQDLQRCHLHAPILRVPILQFFLKLSPLMGLPDIICHFLQIPTKNTQFLISQQHSFLLRSLTRQFYSSLPHNITVLILFPYNTMNRSLWQRSGGNELVQFPGPTSSLPHLRLA